MLAAVSKYAAKADVLAKLDNGSSFGGPEGEQRVVARNGESGGSDTIGPPVRLASTRKSSRHTKKLLLRHSLRTTK